jgi:hypothetical protein
VEQRALISEIEDARFDGFEVVYAEPNPLGVVALVTGDLAAAHAALTDRGVSMVWAVADDAQQNHSQAMQAVQQQLDAAVEDVTRARAGLPGYGQTAIWQEAGAVVVTWRAPVPKRIEELERAREDRAQVVVLPIEYSTREMLRAVDRATDAFQSGSLRGTWYDAQPCDDGSGIRLGVPAGIVHDDALRRRLASVAGMPVVLVPGQAVTPASS